MDAEVVAIANGDRQDTERTRKVLNPSFPLIPGPNLKVQSAYGAYSELERRLRPTIVIIDRNGYIRWKYRGSTDEDRPAVPRLLNVLRELN